MNFLIRFKEEEGFIARGGCAVILMIILFIGTIIGLIDGITSDDWSVFSYCAGFLVLNLIINAIIFGINKSRASSNYSSYNNYNYKKKESRDINIKESINEIDLREDERRRIKEWNEMIVRERVEKEMINLNSSDTEIKGTSDTAVKFCRYCGKRLPDYAIYCKYCGKQIK